MGSGQAYRARTACIEMKSEGTLKVSKKISAIFSRDFREFIGASVTRTGCCRSDDEKLSDEPMRCPANNTKSSPPLLWF